jgi:hypothetical protein
MSDNFHDTFEEGIRDNAGHLALAGALFAHSQRKQQLQSLEASRQHQAQIAKTEAQRLEIEKQRLELEKLKQQTEKDEKEAVRLLRVMMAEAGAEFDGLASRGQLNSSSEGARREYSIPLLMIKIKLIRSRVGILSNLSDIKELMRLEKGVDLLLKNHDKDPIQDAELDIHNALPWINKVEYLVTTQKKIDAILCTEETNLPSLLELNNLHKQLVAYKSDLKGLLEFAEINMCQDMVLQNFFRKDLLDFAQIKSVLENRDSFLSSNLAREIDFRSLLNLDKQTNILNFAIIKIEEWERYCLTDSETGNIITKLIFNGHLAKAKNKLVQLGKRRFGGIVYNHQNVINEMLSFLEELSGLEDADQAIKKNRLFKARYPMIEDSSFVGSQISKIVTVANSVNRKKLMFFSVFLILLIALVIAVLTELINY